jgi:hypothetical protein
VLGGGRLEHYWRMGDDDSEPTITDTIGFVTQYDGTIVNGTGSDFVSPPADGCHV